MEILTELTSLKEVFELLQEKPRTNAQRLKDDVLRRVFDMEGLFRFPGTNSRLLISENPEHEQKVGAAVNITLDKMVWRHNPDAPDITSEVNVPHALKLKIQKLEIKGGENHLTAIGFPNGLGQYYTLAVGVDSDDLYNIKKFWNGAIPKRAQHFRSSDRARPNIEEVLRFVPSQYRWNSEIAQALKKLNDLGVLNQVVEDPLFVRSVLLATPESFDDPRILRHLEL